MVATAKKLGVTLGMMMLLLILSIWVYRLQTAVSPDFSRSLRLVAVALYQYAEDHGEMPPGLDELFRADYFPREVLERDGRRVEMLVYLGAGRRISEVKSDEILIYQVPIDRDGRTAVLLGDGSVRYQPVQRKPK